MTESISFDVVPGCSYLKALNRVIDTLKREGFGVLTRIDIHGAFQEKLGEVRTKPRTGGAV